MTTANRLVPTSIIGMLSIALFGLRDLISPAGLGDCRLQITRALNWYVATCAGDCDTYAAPYKNCWRLTTQDDSTFISYECVCANDPTNPTGHVQATKACNAKLTTDADGHNPSWTCYLDNPELCPASVPPPSDKCKKLDPVPQGTNDACSCMK